METRRQALKRVLRDLWGHLLGERIVERADTMFGVATVRDLTWEGERMRVLDVAGTYQSATFLDDRYTIPPFPYLRLFGRIFEVEPEPHDLLMLGGGALAFPKYALARDAKTTVDVVEVDPTVLRLASDHFLLDRLEADYAPLATGRLNIFCEEGRAFLERSSGGARRYDAILIDCYCAADSVSSLEDDEAVRLAYGCLTEAGLLVFNLISAVEGEGALPLQSLASSLMERFSHAVVLSEGKLPREAVDNRCVIASDAPLFLEGQIILF